MNRRWPIAGLMVLVCSAAASAASFEVVSGEGSMNQGLGFRPVAGKIAVQPGSTFPRAARHSWSMRMVAGFVLPRARLSAFRRMRRVTPAVVTCRRRVRLTLSRMVTATRTLLTPMRLAW
jgi:hypothetical protein